jgi:predicted AlkP superfamily pyrophosphatase or phosphodiesterase
MSFDALGDRFLDRDTLPNFHAMMSDGVRAPFQPEFPSKTFPNHYSMATGLTPGQHGITINQFFDPIRKAWFHRTSANDGSFFAGEPIWASAERAGIRTAAYFWTGSEADIAGVRPSYWFPFDATVPDDVKIKQAMAWLRLPADKRPRLIMMYSGVVDVPGHRYGPDAPDAFAGVRSADKTLGALRDSLKQFASLKIDLIVVSDHGLVYVPREHDIDLDSLVPPQGALVDDEHATLSVWADPANPGLNLDSLAALYRKIPHTKVFRPGELPSEWQTEQNRRFGDIFLLADPGYEYVTTNPRAVYTLGEHGYDPKTPEMMGVFLAAGPDFKSNTRLPARENRTLHDLLAQLLHLTVQRTTAETNFGLR